MPDAQTTGATADGVSALLRRVLPRHHEQVDLHHDPSLRQGDEVDAFEIRQATASPARVEITGSSASAQTSGLGWYLRHVVHVPLTWDVHTLDLPSELPVPAAPIRQATHLAWRHYFNPVTFSYSLAFWDWERWEREIDWMALHGINLPLAITGQEAVWQAVYRDLGLTDAELDDFFTGAAWLPFGWMGCIDGWGGPLPDGWIDARRTLQERIVAREREVGMTPLLQGFTGHVPAALAQHYPDVTLHQLQWEDIGESVMLDPGDPLFAEIGQKFIRTQTAMYGTDHIYAADTFIEMDPPSNDPDDLRETARAILGGMTAEDPEATWVMQGWLFHYRSAFWQPEQIEAFLTAVPDDRMILMDLWAEQHSVWKRTQAFHGKPWLWCMVDNFGGRFGPFAPLETIATGPATAAADPEGGQLVGIGMVPEGIGQNPVLYNLMTETAWQQEPIQLERWLPEYVHRRYGVATSALLDAWTIYQETLYDWDGSFDRLTSAVVSRRPSLERKPSFPASDAARLTTAWGHLISAAPDISGVGAGEAYQMDLITFGGQAIADHAALRYRSMQQAAAEGDLAAWQRESGAFLQHIVDLDELLGTRRELLLGTWLAEATRWGENEADRARLEWNARTLVTLWTEPGSVLNDYSRRFWSGLLSGFALPRWQRFVEFVSTALSEGEPIEEQAIAQELMAWEEAWAHQRGGFPTEPTGDTLAFATRLQQALPQ